MRYGIADGPVTAGVLSGKCPAFDVWGSTVNLASRMKVHICGNFSNNIYQKGPNPPFSNYYLEIVFGVKCYFRYTDTAMVA